MYFSNEPQYGGKMLDAVKDELKYSDDVAIASGYVSHDVLDQFREDFARIVSNKGRFRLLVGMAFYEGLAARKLNLLENIHRELNTNDSRSGVYVAYSRRFHGKIYSFKNHRTDHVYIGSSNFSRSGLSENLECTALISDPPTKSEIESYLDFLFDTENAVSIDKAEITVPGSKEYLERIALKNLSDLERYEPKNIDTSLSPYFDFSLRRIVEKEKSNLNVYFGKGRWARSTGKVSPRPWYEVELIADQSINRNPLYPKGEFIAYTDDGYVIPMRTSGDYYKNIRSRGNLRLLGQWIKGKLQVSNALLPLTPVTMDTLDQYGKDALRFYKIGEKKYKLEF